MNKCYVGMTRFSLVSQNSKAWVVSQQDDYLEKLFSSSRLDDRLFLFSKSLLALSKAIKSSSTPVYHFVFYSDILPEEYKLKLLKVCNDYSFIYPVQLDSKKNESLTRVIEVFLFNQGIENGALVGMYGLDDDDFLGSSYFSYSDYYLKESFVGFRISYGLGMIGLYDQERFFNIRESYFPKVNIGILTIGKIQSGKIQLPQGGSHMLIDKASPVILDSRECMYFWTRHKGQDTNTRRNDEFGINVFNLDSLPLVEPNELQKTFPVIYKYLAQEKKITTIPNLDDPFDIVFKGRLKLLFEVNVSSEGKLRPLISFTFRDINNNIIDDLDCKSVGIALSANKDIGFYRYISAVTSVGNEIILNLPAVVHSVSFKVCSRGNQVTVNNIRFFELE